MFSKTQATNNLKALGYLLAFVSISSCTSTATYNSSISLQNNYDPLRARGDVVEGVTPLTLPAACQVYYLPKHEPVPTVPMGELSSLSEDDHERKINLLLDYTVALRKHLSKERTRQAAHYEEYISRCRSDNDTPTSTPADVIDELARRK